VPLLDPVARLRVFEVDRDDLTFAAGDLVRALFEAVVLPKRRDALAERLGRLFGFSGPRERLDAQLARREEHVRLGRDDDRDARVCLFGLEVVLCLPIGRHAVGVGGADGAERCRSDDSSESWTSNATA